jgi:hypothetical protein
MTIEQLNQLDLIAVEEEFGCHLPEEIAQCTDLKALMDLSHLATLRICELSRDHTDRIDAQILKLRDIADED